MHDPETTESRRLAANAPENELGSEAATRPSPPNATIEAEALPLPGGLPQPSATDDPCRQVLGAISSLDERAKNLTELVERRLLYDQTKEDAFHRLYEELDALKRDRDFEQLRPLFVDLILLYDRIESVRQALANDLSSSFPETLATLSEELLEVLRRQGIELVEQSPPVFAPSFQKAIGTEATTIETENNQVARVVRRGFACGERIIRAEGVIVKKLTRAETP